MLAFIDSPVQLMVLLVVLLIVFGPQKLPEIGQQLGRAIRDLKRATNEFSSSLSMDDRHDTHYDPPRYDSYGNAYEESRVSTIPEEDVWEHSTPESKAQAALAAPEPPRGDFAAAALSDASADYGVGLSSSPAPSAATEHSQAEASTPPTVTPRPASNTVPRG